MDLILKLNICFDINKTEGISWWVTLHKNYWNHSRNIKSNCSKSKNNNFLEKAMSMNKVMNRQWPTRLTFTEIGKGRLTVGKIYGGLLILENWKATKFGKTPMLDVVVSTYWNNTWCFRTRSYHYQRRLNTFLVRSCFYCISICIWYVRWRFPPKNEPGLAVTFSLN